MLNEPEEPKRPPVTVLCGFLGAGKTTVLQHLLKQTDGERWALVVNDVGAINIDARQVAQRALGTGERTRREEVVELENGCVCCSLKDELGESLAELALTGRPKGPPGEPFDHLIVETTGVAEPRAIAQLFVQRNPFGRSLSDFARLNALVTVVDAVHFHRLWREHVAHEPGAKERSLAAGGAQRTLFELLLEQVEVSDLLLVNKCDLASSEQVAQVLTVIEGLNPRAERHALEQGQISREVVLDRARFVPQETLTGARWLRSLNALAPGVARSSGQGVVNPRASRASSRDFEEKYGLRSLVYQARRPFDREKFGTLVRSGIPGLVRAKGFCWWADLPDEMGFLSVAGDVVRLDTLNYWWAALIENGKATRDDRPEMIRALWVEPNGDRRQELVFIGQNLDENALRAALDQCLL
ncbi:MAG TPA: GTP-binding protein [Opitutaceae bacterium]|nr:GTP-binding protein [Opitutaceae bacterium]